MTPGCSSPPEILFLGLIVEIPVLAEPGVGRWRPLTPALSWQESSVGGLPPGVTGEKLWPWEGA